MLIASKRALDPARAIRGGCLCGSVQFAVAPPYAWFSNCHCSMCRKHHGALFGSGLGVARERFVWLAGTSEIVRYRATSAFERPFCRRCGSTLPGVSQDPDWLHVPAGLLERLNAVPRTHIFVGSKSPFTVIADDLPQHAAYPPGMRLPAVARRARVSAERTEGSCLCAVVAYRVDAPLERIEHCACGLCRKRTGSPYATSALVPPGNVRWLRGAGLVTVFRGAAGRDYATAFCAHCGGLLPVAGAAAVAVPAGALDTIAAAGTVSPGVARVAAAVVG